MIWRIYVLFRYICTSLKLFVMLNNAYCSDKYQYTMGKSFLESGNAERRAVFNLFYRTAPENNNWAVVSGVDEVIEMVGNLGNMPESFFEKFLPGDEYAGFRKYLSAMKFTGNIYAMREGEIAFPKEPVIIVEAPLVQAQVLETPMLCIMNHQMAVATKASRVTRATSKPVSEFGSRRAHGPWAATYGAKAAVIAGCASTSNVLTEILYGKPSTGTMAHSFVSSFGCSVDGEFQAFDTYIKSHRNEGLTLLIDTYDTLRCGIRNAIKAFKANGIDNSHPYGYGVRLDSGDLAYLSTQCRKMLDRAGLTECKIFATNSLDEYLISDLEKQGARIDCYGVGDAIATSKNNPCFGNVYKLVEIDHEPVLKRSEDKIKLINPGFQITYRIVKAGLFRADVTCIRGDTLSRKIERGETITIRDEFDSDKYTTFYKGTYKARALQTEVMAAGKDVSEKISLDGKRQYYLDNLSRLGASEKRLVNPHYYKVDISDTLYDTKMGLLDKIQKEIESKAISAHVSVDMLYDFIDGTMACHNGNKAAVAARGFIKAHPEMPVLFVCDHHPADHSSFKENGGIWPAHCIQGTRGAEIEESLAAFACEEMTFYKGRNRDTEQYSGFEGTNNMGESLDDKLQELGARRVYVSGIATEYCIKATCTDLLAAGYEVYLLTDALAYVDEEGHEKAIAEMDGMGIKML